MAGPARSPSGHFKATKAGESFDLQHITRTPPSLGAKPPAKATVLFDGTNMNSWAKMKEKDWLTEDGPSLWHLVPTAAMEVVPRTGSLISRKSFGDAKIHVEFRNLGGPTNSGVYIQDRYEANINEMYGRLDGNPCAGFDNCTPAEAKPGIRCSRPPLEWQTLDIDFHAPRFDAAGKRTAAARVTLLFNGTAIYTRSRARSRHPKRRPPRRGAHRPNPTAGARHAGPIPQYLGVRTMKNRFALILIAAAAILPGAKKPGDDTSNPAYAVVPFPITADPSGKPAKPVFKHPGVLLNGAQLAEIKRRVAAGIEPQKSAFEALKASKLGRARLHAASPRDRGVRFELEPRPRLQGRAGR